jgi:hypothetical protein
VFQLIQPFVDLANQNLAALSQCFLTPTEDAEQKADNSLWRHILENQARFVERFTDELLGVMALNRRLLFGQMAKLSVHGEHVATQLAHTAVRAVAIATQARREKRDRRIFPLPLPAERRDGPRADRRQRHSLIVGHHAAI